VVQVTDLPHLYLQIDRAVVEVALEQAERMLETLRAEMVETVLHLLFQVLRQLTQVVVVEELVAPLEQQVPGALEAVAQAG
jgi:hypothetical protein